MELMTEISIDQIILGVKFCLDIVHGIFLPRRVWLASLRLRRSPEAEAPS